MEYRAHPNSYRRIDTSLTSARQFFGKEPVSLIDSGRLEEYKAWRVKDHGIRDITLRHDLHALSKFFGYAVTQRWAGDNPVRNVKIPSDADAIRIHVLTFEEEREYFVRAAKHRNLNDLRNPLAHAGIDLATLAAILGHSSIRLVQRYVHPTAEHKRSAMLHYDEILRTAEKAASEREGRPN